MNQYTLAKSVDPRVFDVFQKLTKNVDEQNLNKMLERIKLLVKDGKKLERAMADVLEIFKLSGPVNA